MECPREHGCSGFMSSDEQRHQVVTQLPGGHILTLGDDQKLEEGQLVPVFGRVLQGVSDEFIQDGIDQGQVLAVILLVSEHRVRPRQVPVRDNRLGAALRLAQKVVDRADQRRLTRCGAKVVVEDGLADDVERSRSKLFLHVDLGHVRRSYRNGTLQVISEVHSAFHHLPSGLLQPLLVKARHDRPAALPPGFRISRDQPLAHDGLEHFRQDTLCVKLRRAREDALDNHGIGDDDH
mmetsp:Transcript_67411/g.158044  ORF Transcript_67411/g.158044 Transcript_67411/m.158044 type:complete len:236 (-) Transcript_67411:954-1661(-)